MSVRKELPALTSGWEHLPEGASIENLARFAVDVATLEAEGADGTMAAVRFWVPATEQGDPVPFVIWRAAAENFLRRAAEESGLGVEKALEVFTEGALQVQASFSKAAESGVLRTEGSKVMKTEENKQEAAEATERKGTGYRESNRVPTLKLDQQQLLRSLWEDTTLQMLACAFRLADEDAPDSVRWSIAGIRRAVRRRRLIMQYRALFHTPVADLAC